MMIRDSAAHPASAPTGGQRQPASAGAAAPSRVTNRLPDRQQVSAKFCSPILRVDAPDRVCRCGIADHAQEADRRRLARSGLEAALDFIGRYRNWLTSNLDVAGDAVAGTTAIVCRIPSLAVRLPEIRAVSL